VLAGLGDVPLVVRTLSYADSRDPLFLPATGGVGTFVVVGLDPEAEPGADPRPSLRRATAGVEARLRLRFPRATLRWTGEEALNFDLRRAIAEEVRAGEARALPLTLVLLFVAFGALVATLLPLASGALAVVLSLGAAVLIGRAWPLAASLQSVVSMLGLGLGIDYSLLTLSRFREARREGRGPLDAAEQAATYAGHTVALSGASVALGFLGLLLVPLREIRSVGVGGLLVVATSVLLATTLVPALLACLGDRVEIGRLRPARNGDGTQTWRRWAAWVTAHPLLVLAVAGSPLLALALQTTRLSAALPRDWLPAMESTSAVRALRQMGRAGVAQGVRVILELPPDAFALGAEGWAAGRRLESVLSADPRVARVLSLRTAAGERADDLDYVSFLPAQLKHAFVAAEGDALLLELVPQDAASPQELSRLVRELRGADAAALSGVAGARLRVGGLPAFNTDYEDAVAGRSPTVVGFVLAGTLVALLAGFRSVLVPLKAIALNVLSVAAAFGAVVLVFQEGWGGRLVGLEAPLGGLFPAVPLLVFAIVFGLSMDYEVFLVARVAEAREAGLTESEALSEGMARTGGVISSAAAIMVGVFGAFALGDLLLVRILGFTLAVAVLLDATLIRMAVGPALLSLAGRWNWWPGRCPLPKATLPVVVLLALCGAACSVRTLAVRSLGDALASGTAVYDRDDDPELVRDASPFTLKTVEALLESAPKDRGLLRAAASGFTGYAFAYVQQEADFAEEHDLARAEALRARARRLYLRARDYGFREMETDFPGFRLQLRHAPDAALAGARRRHAPVLYWTALAWAGAISAGRDDPELTADQRLVETMMRRALALDEALDQGAIHDFFIAWEGSHLAVGGSVDEARRHRERSLALSGGQRVAPLVIYAETVCVARQDRADFERLLGQALAQDADGAAPSRLQNLIQQRRARWLLARADLLFVDEPEGGAR
jgi:RND superfamily putative drug exporter